MSDLWREAAVCAQTDLDAFFPENGGSTKRAKTICGGCPVKRQCLETALQNGERFGIWGGTTPGDRALLLKCGAA